MLVMDGSLRCLESVGVHLKKKAGTSFYSCTVAFLPLITRKSNQSSNLILTGMD